MFTPAQVQLCTPLMREWILLPRGCSLPAPKTHMETSHSALMDGDTCKAQRGEAGEWHPRGFRPSQSAAKTTGYFRGPSPAGKAPSVLAGGLVCGKTLGTDLPLPPTGRGPRAYPFTSEQFPQVPRARRSGSQTCLPQTGATGHTKLQSPRNASSVN